MLSDWSITVALGINGHTHNYPTYTFIYIKGEIAAVHNGGDEATGALMQRLQ